MIDQSIIDEIVRRVIERLLQDSRFQSLVASSGPVAASTNMKPKPVSSVRQHFGRLLSEWDVLTVHRSGGRAMGLKKSVIITPLARERARDLGVELIIT